MPKSHSGTYPTKRGRGAMSLALGIAVLLPSFLPQPAAAAPTGPTLELRTVSDEVVVHRFGGGRVHLDLGIYLAALGEPFEVQVHRDSYKDPVEVDQILRGDDGSTQVRSLPPTILDENRGGFEDFYQVRVLRRSGDHVGTISPSLCPGGFERQRVNDEGPTATVYPFLCRGNPFSTGIVWGIEEGWAIDVADSGGWSMKLDDGRYRAIVSINDAYSQILDLPVTDNVKVKFRVRGGGGGCHGLCPGPVSHATRTSSAQEGSATATSGVPEDLSPDPSTLPDMIPLPAWGMFLQRGKEKTRLNFAANVWTSGAQSLVVEGFRRSGEATMDAYQYFYENGEPVGRAPVGELAFDTRRGHRHWHFLQFARYSLLDSTKTEVLRSKKEAFCLASTDAINLLLPGAEWNPFNTDLSTACGESDSLWIREVLPLGWGDTYFQGIPGQSFDVTDLPNGTYYVAVEANPEGLLYEQSSDNNTKLRKVYLKGAGRFRRVVVPPWQGIDTEGRAGFGFGFG